jgi:hypothetical protein
MPLGVSRSSTMPRKSPGTSRDAAAWWRRSPDQAERQMERPLTAA